MSSVRKKKLIDHVSRLRGLQTLKAYVELGQRASKYDPFKNCTYKITYTDRQMMIEGMRPFSTTGLAQTGQLHIRFTDVGPCLNEIPWEYLKAWEKSLREAILPESKWPEEDDISESERTPRHSRIQGGPLVQGPQNPGPSA